MTKIYNEDCFVTMQNILPQNIDLILTSPPYNTNLKANGRLTTKDILVEKNRNYLRYDEFSDGMSNEDYCKFTSRLFNEFNRILKPNGCVLYNLSYGAENTEGMFLAINKILTETPFTIADVIVWKKKSALPNNCSSNRLTRITEYIFVICRKSEKKTFRCNKEVKSLRKTGQKSYENIFNFIEAKNNDGSCPLNKATYSSELCEKLLKIYAPKDSIVYDPFIGTGTTAVACKNLGLDCIGSELSKKQCEWANDRLMKNKEVRVVNEQQ